jgi:uncharacterized membrane protein
MKNVIKNEQLIPVFFFQSKNSIADKRIKKLLDEVIKENPFKLVTIQPTTIKKSPIDLPYVQIGPYRLEGGLRKKQLLIALNAAHDRINQLTRISQQKKIKPPSLEVKFGFWDHIALWWAKNYLTVICVLLFLYISLPFVAPLLMKIQQVAAAEVIYTIYKPLCHQFAFRSYFLFGVQPVYPRSLAGLTFPITWELITGDSIIDIIAAKDFIGDEFLGYKVAMCERDIAMYGSFLIFAIIYIASRKRISSFSFWIWFVAGVLPIAIDGVSQLSGVGLNLLSWIQPRESTPFLRTVTGTLFGFFSGWYVIPLLEQAFVGTRDDLIIKFEAYQQMRIKK